MIEYRISALGFSRPMPFSSVMTSVFWLTVISGTPAEVDFSGDSNIHCVSKKN